MEVQEIETQFGALATDEGVDAAVTRIGEFYEENLHLLERRAPGQEGLSEGGGRTIEEICFDLATYDDIELIASKYKLTSIGELIDMAGRQNIDPPILAWMIRDKMDQAPLMERLNANSAVSEDIKRLICQRHPF